MPERLIDGDALWRSDKLAQVEPPIFRAEYANMLPLANDEGMFECNARRVWSDVYSYNRPDMDVETIQEILDEFERVGLLRRSTNKGKEWGFWIGIESRLPVANGRSSGRTSLVAPGRSQSQPVAVAFSPVAVEQLNGNENNDLQTQEFGNEIASYSTYRSNSISNLTNTDVFRQAKRIFRRFVGVSLGSIGNRGNQWQDLLDRSGPEKVLAAIELWAREGGKSLRELNWPFSCFLKNADEFIEAVTDTKQKVEQNQYDENQIKAHIETLKAQKDAEDKEFELARKKEETGGYIEEVV